MIFNLCGPSPHWDILRWRNRVWNYQSFALKIRPFHYSSWTEWSIMFTLCNQRDQNDQNIILLSTWTWTCLTGTSGCTGGSNFGVLRNKNKNKNHTKKQPNQMYSKPFTNLNIRLKMFKKSWHHHNVIKYKLTSNLRATCEKIIGANFFQNSELLTTRWYCFRLFAVHLI